MTEYTINTKLYYSIVILKLISNPLQTNSFVKYNENELLEKQYLKKTKNTNPIFKTMLQ